MAVKDSGDSFWEKTINGMSFPSPEGGTEAPSIESIKKTPMKKTRLTEGARKVIVQKITTHVYVFTDADGRVYTSHTSQNLQILGTMPLEQGLKIAQEDTFS